MIEVIFMSIFKENKQHHSPLPPLQEQTYCFEIYDACNITKGT
jgi:hypothetical protein